MILVYTSFFRARVYNYKRGKRERKREGEEGVNIYLLLVFLNNVNKPNIVCINKKPIHVSYDTYQSNPSVRPSPLIALVL